MCPVHIWMAAEKPQLRRRQALGARDCLQVCAAARHAPGSSRAPPAGRATLSCVARRRECVLRATAPTARGVQVHVAACQNGVLHNLLQCANGTSAAVKPLARAPWPCVPPRQPRARAERMLLSDSGPDQRPALMPRLPPNDGTPYASRRERTGARSARWRARRVPEPAQGSAAAFPAPTRRVRSRGAAGKPAELRDGKMVPQQTPRVAPAAAQPPPQRHAAADSRQRALRSAVAPA